MGGLESGHSAYQLFENIFLAQVLRNAKDICAAATTFTRRDKAELRETFTITALQQLPKWSTVHMSAHMTRHLVAMFVCERTFAVLWS